MRAMEKIISCSLAFVPLAKVDYVKDVEIVLGIIEKSGLAYDTGAFSTVVQGSKADVFNLIRAVYDHMDDLCSFILDLRISNACGCGV